jgi:hypothetical protein
VLKEEAATHSFDSNELGWIQEHWLGVAPRPSRTALRVTGVGVRQLVASYDGRAVFERNLDDLVHHACIGAELLKQRIK